MILAKYSHRLPADYDTGVIRARVLDKGPAWDNLADLHFKAFLLRERGTQGAAANEYASLYLWQRDSALIEMLQDKGFKGVIDSFGRPPVETYLAVDARRGNGSDAKVAVLETSAIPLDADLGQILETERARNEATAAAPGAIVSVVALDVARWQVTRALIAESLPGGGARGDLYQVMHLSRPLLNGLPAA